MPWCYNIRIYHKCEDRIEKSVPRITDWHHEACRVMTNGDPEGLRVSFICIVVGQGNPTRRPEYFVRNEAMPSFRRNYSGPRVGFPCPTTIHHGGYFFSPGLWLFKVLYEFCQFRILFFYIFCVCSNLKNKFTNEFSRCRKGCNHSLAPTNRTKIAFQALGGFFYCGLKLTLV